MSNIRVFEIFGNRKMLIERLAGPAAAVAAVAAKYTARGYVVEYL